MNNTINISLDDVKDFLKTLGYEWNGLIVKNNMCTHARDLSDFKSNTTLTTLRLQLPKFNNDKILFKDALITKTDFIFYQETIGSDIDDICEYEVETDYTEQWVKFLIQRHGEQYKDYVKILCKTLKQQEINNAKREVDKIKRTKLEIMRKLKEKLLKWKKLEELVDNTTEFKK